MLVLRRVCVEVERNVWALAAMVAKKGVWMPFKGARGCAMILNRALSAKICNVFFCSVGGVPGATPAFVAKIQVLLLYCCMVVGSLGMSQTQ